jgi:hypothetical protein
VAAVSPASIAKQHDHTGQAAVPQAADWKPELFDDHADETVIALIDLIIPATDTPGAKAALVNRHMDHILAASPEEHKTQFREGLWWMDGYAIRKHGRPFSGCSTAHQSAILQMLEANTEPEAAPGHRFFQMLKGMTTEIYYATEAGFRELNKDGRVPATFACRHPEHA